MNDPFLPEELRLFIAAELPESWQQVLTRAEHDLEQAGLRDLRWVRPEGIHLTLKFLGEAGRHLLPDLSEAMTRAAAGVAPFELQLNGLGSFGGKGRARVLWAGLAGEIDLLRRLHAAVDTATAQIGFAREVRPYSPHLTLARVPVRAVADTGSGIAAALRQVTLEEAPPWRVQALGLIRSQLGRGGAAYTCLTTAPIGKVEGA